MNDYFSAVQAAFSADGVIARAQPHFRPRGGQTEMALAVAETISDGGVLVVEAGTGVGKTYSYLVPVLLSGQRVLISTATKALQDQLFSRDLPGLAQMLGLPLRMAQLKGRPSYLCQHHLGQARQGRGAPKDPQLLRTLAQVEEWARVTRSGDLAELSSIPEDSPVWPLVTSTRDNCLGSACPQFGPCHLNVARREALVADVVVVNHHLFFADLEVRESGVAQLLPSVGVVVFDEAHQLNETGIQFAGTLVGTAQLQGYARDFLAQTLEHARGMGDWMQLSADLERTVRDLRLAAGRTAVGERLRWLGAVPDGLDAHVWSHAFSSLGQALHAALVALGAVEEMAAELRQLYARGEALLRRLALFGKTSSDDSVRWLDVGSRHLRMIESPLSIARIVRTRLLQEGEGADGAGPRPGAWIFTSATLGDDADLSWFTEPCGLRDARVLRVDSPFDYAHQAAVYVPQEFPAPGTPAHSAEVAALVQRSAEVLGGRTLVLTTTTKALQAIGAALQAQFGLFSDLEVLVQGQAPKQLLLERFRAGRQGAGRQGAGQAGGRGCILVASATFWEGVDMPGDALELVVIDKLPFPPPDDPLVEARSQQLEAVGRSAFRDYMLPEAAMALKQGAGRLIRRETDQGVLVIADTRLVAKPYGRRLLAALPPMRRLHTSADYDAALQALALTRTSTRDSSSSAAP
ncbi:ATP-dependent DNA helicase [Comamonas endophytica]|uniref:ATP-dependent DNA helicase n=1 Tax=Comamonas endophytica TaxID=2949090 RepID=A0ABY6GAN6_9BURK|nr:ATP-dependent DNA helicase [Acidovorax sp. 5MLIR]MCD2512001.1 ATP-dependent DNA helicase [Acidovorax sp. D4N7]UYG51780.1 ATP-dependent DNA helicase [Acidovorax sp. 5MLIR]